MSRPIKYTLTFLLAFTSWFSISYAQEPEPLDQVIDQVANTYGVDKLNRSRTIRLEEEVRINYADHDYSPDFNQLTHGRRYYVFELKNEKASAEYYTIFSGNANHARVFEMPEGYVMIDYGNGTYIPQQEASYVSEFGGAIRSFDTLLAHTLVKDKSTAQYKGSTLWLGKPHHIVSFDFPNSPPLVLYVQKETGYISKMSRTLERGDTRTVISYTFSDHDKKQGVGYARESTIFIGRDLLLVSFDRNIVINDRADKSNFKLDKGIVREAERMDTSEMTVEQVAGQTHYVGQGSAYSAIIDAGDYLIALGASSGFADRMKAYKDHTTSTKPLRYALVADHHQVEMGGAIDAAVLGAKLITTPGAKPVLETLFEGADVKPIIETVSESRTIDDVTFMNISTGHAQNVVVAYILDGKILYQADHYISPFANERFYTKNSAVTLYKAVKDKGFELDWLLSSESRKPETWQDFVLAIKEHKPKHCPPTREICKDIWG